MKIKFQCTDMCQQSAAELGYSEWELLVGTESEEEIENKNPTRCTREALSWIDEHQQRGTLSAEIEKIKAKIAKINPILALPLIEQLKIQSTKMSPTHKAASKAFSRFCKGLNSPDLEQRARFLRLSEFIGKHLHREFGSVGILPILECLEEPAKSPGRPSQGGRPSMKNREILAKMKPCIANGITVAAAAREFANGDISKQQVLERGWRWKAGRRTAER